MTRIIKASHFRDNFFPHAELTKIVGKPSYADILMLHNEVKANLASVSSPLGGGSYGHMALAMTPATYVRLTGNSAFIRPADPGPFVAGNATGADLQLAKQVHDDATNDFLEINVLERCIINQLQAALDRAILLHMINKISGLLNSSIPDIFEFLYRAYGNLSSITIAEARQKILQLQYTHQDPIENIFDKINDFSTMADAYGNPESDKMLIELGMVVMMKAVIFADDIGDWHNKPETSKTWSAFQQHFISAQTSYKKNRPAETSASLGYSVPQEQANAVLQADQELADANAYIAQLEAAQQANLANSIFPAPSQAPATVPDPIQDLIAKITALQAEVQACKTMPSTSTPVDESKKKKKKKEKSERKYCWTHGACAHTGHECNHPKEGHKKDATFTNRMDGSTKDCFWLESSSA